MHERPAYRQVGIIGTHKKYKGFIVPRGGKLSHLSQSVISPKVCLRLSWMDYYFKTKNTRVTCRHFGISPDTFYCWKRRYQKECVRDVPKRVKVSIKIMECYYARYHNDNITFTRKRENMSKETQPLPFEEIKQGSPENYISYRKLTPDAFRQIKGQLGKPINVTFVKESWVYQGPTDEEDHSTSETHVSGTLIKVDERTIEVEINSGKTTDDDSGVYGAYIEPKGTHKEFPFYQKQFTLRKYAEISQISWFTVEDQTFWLR